MATKKNIHTVFNPERKMWESKQEKNAKPLKSAHTKDQAVKNSIKIAKENKVEHVIHKKDGKISDKDSYGNDSNPPKDKVH